MNELVIEYENINTLVSSIVDVHNRTTRIKALDIPNSNISEFIGMNQCKYKKLHMVSRGIDRFIGHLEKGVFLRGRMWNKRSIAIIRS